MSVGVYQEALSERMEIKMMEAMSLSTCVFGRESQERPFEKMVETAAAAGYRYLELAMGHEVAGRRALVRSAGLDVWSVHGTLGYGAASLDESERQSAVQREIRRLESSAEYAGCPYVLHYVDRYHVREHGMQFCRSIEELYDVAHRLGLVLALETAPYKPETDERYPDSGEIARFVRSFQQGDIGMTLDVNHSNLNEDLETAIANCAGLIVNVHISDNHGRREEHLPPGKGSMDFGRMVQGLRQSGYQGPANLEYGDATREPTAAALGAERLEAARLLGLV